MANRRQRRDELRQWCAEAGPEDGADPRDFHKRESEKPNNRKALQLCEQVRRALYWAMGTECDAPTLQCVEVVSVEPAPTSARLLVTFAVTDEGASVEDVSEQLGQSAGLLRAEVARSINRRKTPELIFRVVPG